MKKLSLFSLLGLLTSVAMPIYAQDVYFDENYIVVPDGSFVENVDEEDVVVEEINEENPLLKMDGDSKFLIEDYITDDSLVLDDMLPIHLEYSNNVNPLVRILAGGLGLFSVVLMYLILVYFALLPISVWEIYRRAGKKGWAFLVPYWGTMVYSEIAGMNKWLGLLPLVVTIWGFFDGIVGSGVYGIVLNVLCIILLLWSIIANYRIARRYGWNIFASILHAILIFCPITILVLGLGNYKYQAKSETIVEA